VLSRTDESLARWTTLRLGGPAKRLVEAGTRDELYALVRQADDEGEPVLVLGGGSNLVIGDAGFAGTVVRITSEGVTVDADGLNDAALVTVEAGENWDALVARAVAEQWSGVEALSGIPGTVGAVPIQNVGAYGQEVADTVSAVHVFDRVQVAPRTLTPGECEFGYRSSVFKRNPERYVVGAVTLRLPRSAAGGVIRYAELARRLEIPTLATAPAADVRDAVLELRRRKGMVLDPDDHDTWSVGSFFTNPFVEVSALPAGAPAYPQPDGRVKTSAAWLIDRAGLGKGYGGPRVSLSTKHSLALTNRGGATTADLLALAAEVRGRVEAAFGIRLEPEPTLVNCSL
jgi:UDP-N-acetylmuramate dehydrogenase